MNNGFMQKPLRSLLILIMLSVWLAAAARDACADDSSFFTHASVGILAGIWKPSALDQYPSRPLQLVEGSYPTAGLVFMSPAVHSYAIRVSVFQWMQKHREEQTSLESVTLRHLSFDLVNFIITQSRISPIISLGPVIIWSREVPRDSPKDDKIPLDRAGYGINIGTGLEIQMSAHSGAVFEYQYSYCKFAKKVGLTDNYSGPHLSLKLFFMF